LPLEYLLTKYNKDIYSYGIIQYFKYPLLSPENKNFSENVVSIKLYDEKINTLKINNLKIPVEIIIKKPNESFKECLFIDPKTYLWNDGGCKSIDLGDYLQCSCIHLTDFSISKFNPVKILEDVFNLLSDAWIINDFNTFENLNWDNAVAIYIYSGILFIYFIGLHFTIKYDKNDSFDNYVYEVDKVDTDNSCCSKDYIIESIKEIKKYTKDQENAVIKKNLKYFEWKLEKLNLDNIILKNFNLENIIIKIPQLKSDYSSNCFNDNNICNGILLFQLSIFF